MMDEAEITRRNGGTGADLLGDGADIVAHLVEVSPVQRGGLLEPLVEQLDVTADDREGVVNVVQHPGVNLGGGARHFLAQGRVAQAAVQIVQALGGGGKGLRNFMEVEGAGHGLADGGQVEGFAEVVTRAEAERLARGFQRLVGGEHEHLGLGGDLLEAAQHVDAGAAGHADVHNGEVDGIFARVQQRFLAGVHHMHVEIMPEHHAQRMPRPLLVVHDQEGVFHLRGKGRVRSGG